VAVEKVARALKILQGLKPASIFSICGMTEVMP
jgi:hypothetical protein